VTVGAALEAQVRAGGADAQIVDIEHGRIDRARDLRRLGLREDPALAGVLRGAEGH